jgi:hypothetical protein
MNRAYMVCNGFHSQHAEYMSRVFGNKREALRYMHMQAAESPGTWMLCDASGNSGMARVIETLCSD